ncbi:ribbon-helix-helix domain-containing protein [Xanthobacter sp. DSM 14520]|uniref:ribbon-helix-helix domain-containing protein n=1 Tax=Xanthobacter autotrophicus (strain ATCC BAA-1158 / Py2) TaxID=78245 RepID=UPI0037284D80
MSPQKPHEQDKLDRRSELKRSVVVAGRKTSVTLEAPFWEAFQEIARERGITAAALVNEIDARRATTNLSAAIRIYVLDYYRALVRNLRSRSHAS